MGQIQTETPYYQPSAGSQLPFPPVESLNDPSAQLCKSNSGPCEAWGLRIVDSQDINVYGAGLYSFYNSYNTCESLPLSLNTQDPYIHSHSTNELTNLPPPTACSVPGNGEACQYSLLSIEGGQTSNVNIYNLNTVGVESMITRDGVSLANYSDNVDVFPDTIAVFRLE